MQESTNREKVLKKIRKALIHKTNNRFQSVDGERPLYATPDTSPEETFALSFTKLGGRFVFCEDGNDFLDQLAAVSGQMGWKRLLCWDDKISSMLDVAGIPYSKDDKQFEEGIAGITTCEALVARLGSVMTSSRQASGRRLPVIPTTHLVVAYTSQVVSEVKDALQLIRNKYNEQLPSMIGTITGPSRTADIEKTLVTPAHGPRDIFVFLIDDVPANG
jgi:L-lactate dehydrogenase complex protein LldG